MLDYGFYEMDCIKGMDLINDESVDLILTDLPYGLTKCKWDQRISFELLWPRFKRIIKNNGAVIITAKQPYTTDLINSCREMYRYSLVWLKNASTGFYNAKVMPLQAHEEICVFYRRKPTYNPQMGHGYERKVSKAESRKKSGRPLEVYSQAKQAIDYDSTDRYPISFLYFEIDKHRKALHPTQKPFALFEYLIKTYSNKGDLVLDCCAGSNTTGAACLATGRNYIGFENDKQYYALGYERVNDISRIIYGKEYSLYGKI